MENLGMIPAVLSTALEALTAMTVSELVCHELLSQNTLASIAILLNGNPECFDKAGI